MLGEYEYYAIERDDSNVSGIGVRCTVRFPNLSSYGFIRAELLPDVLMFWPHITETLTKRNLRQMRADLGTLGKIICEHWGYDCAFILARNERIAKIIGGSKLIDRTDMLNERNENVENFRLYQYMLKDA